MDNNQLSQKSNLNVDLRVIAGLLLVVIAAMLFVWKPWSSTNASDRTVEVTGEAEVTAKPDEFVFYPSYEFKLANNDAALAALTTKSEEVVAKLKDLGVPDNKIKTSSSGYDRPVLYENDAKNATYTLQLTVTVGSIEAAQKVQTYLVTTTPTGSVSPQASFSDKKRKELEGTARDKATKDARAKVEQMADNLDFKIGKVKAITDGAGFNTFPSAIRGEGLGTTDAKSSNLTVQPGENDLSYSVTVVYFIK